MDEPGWLGSAGPWWAPVGPPERIALLTQDWNAWFAWLTCIIICCTHCKGIKYCVGLLDNASRCCWTTENFTSPGYSIQMAWKQERAHHHHELLDDIFFHTHCEMGQFLVEVGH